MTPERKQPYDWPTFDSIQQCASIMKWPYEKLQACQRNGAAGFRHGRVYLGEFLQWLGGDGIEAVDYTAMNKKFIALGNQIAYEKQAGLVVTKELASEVIRNCMTIAFRSIDQWAQEYPTKFEQRDRIYIKQMVDEDTARIREAVEEQFKRLEAEAIEETTEKEQIKT